MNRLGFTCAALALFACGDPRDPFLGMYEGHATWVATWTDSPSTTEQYTDQVHVSPARDGQRVFLSQLCGLPATVSDPDKLEIASVTCTEEGVTCFSTYTVTGGTATLEGARFTVQYAASLVAQCGTQTYSAVVNTTLDATRK